MAYQLLRTLRTQGPPAQCAINNFERATAMNRPRITLSIVSHAQNALVNRLLGDVAHHCADTVQLVITENARDDVALDLGALRCNVAHVRNALPRGFGANHNAAFAHCTTPYYCVCNPDIHFRADPFAALLPHFDDRDVGVVGPLVLSPAGSVEDSARIFPTVPVLLKKLVGAPRLLDYPVDRGCVPVAWVAGMFMVFRSDAFRAVHGFDEGYYLYYEDVDICRRLHESGWSVWYEPDAQVVHDARRASHRDGRLAHQHLASMMRYFTGPRLPGTAPLH